MGTGQGVGFTPTMMQIYLAEIRTHGQKGLAAEMAGTSPSTVQLFKKNFDPDGLFAEAEALALALRSEHITRRLENEFIEGVLEPICDAIGKQVMVKLIDPDAPDGYREVPGWKRKLESAARLRVLERHDPSYREHKEIDVNSKHGALVTSPSLSVDEFQQLAAEVTKRQMAG